MVILSSNTDLWVSSYEGRVDQVAAYYLGEPVEKVVGPDGKIVEVGPDGLPVGSATAPPEFYPDSLPVLQPGVPPADLGGSFRVENGFLVITPRGCIKVGCTTPSHTIGL